MTTTDIGTTAPHASESILDRERTIAAPGFNRWLVPPSALAIHLCIGMAYGFSVFWLPLSRAVGITQPNACPDVGFFGELFSTTCDWKVSDLGWMFTLFFVVLGSAAAIWGGWLERAGPRKAGVVAAFCWCGGLLIGAVGVATHQLWLLLVGPGIIGGIGLGLGYISPVSTLIKWFPDRRGMATGMAIMGFGGGAMIGAPLANILMEHFKTPTSVGVWETFVALAIIYFVFMIGGAFGYRVPPAGWVPAGWTPAARGPVKLITHGNVHLRDAHKTPQFWLVWAVLMPQRFGGDRRARHLVADAAGDFRRPVDRPSRTRLHTARSRPEDRHRGYRGRLYRSAVPAEHHRPVLLGFAVRSNWPQDHLLLLLRARHRALRRLALGGPCRVQGPVRRVHVRHRVDVRRRVRHRAGLSGRPVRDAVRRRHPRAAAHRLVDGRHHRPGGRELHSRGADCGGRPAGSGLRPHDVHPGRHAGGGLHRQCPHQACVANAGS